jgi:hypothetical protein
MNGSTLIQVHIAHRVNSTVKDPTGTRSTDKDPDQTQYHTDFWTKIRPKLAKLSIFVVCTSFHHGGGQRATRLVQWKGPTRYVKKYKYSNPPDFHEMLVYVNKDSLLISYSVQSWQRRTPNAPNILGYTEMCIEQPVNKTTWQEAEGLTFVEASGCSNMPEANY